VSGRPVLKCRVCGTRVPFTRTECDGRAIGDGATTVTYVPDEHAAPCGCACDPINGCAHLAPYEQRRSA